MSKKENSEHDLFENDQFNNDFYGKKSTGYPPPPDGFVENTNKYRLFDNR